MSRLNHATKNVHWKKYVATIPMEAYKQKDIKAGNTVKPPTPKAMISVTDVTVMATPKKI